MALDAHIITESDLDDNQTNDQDTYLIRQDEENSDNKFLNHLAFYISCMSKEPNLHSQKNMISKLIDDYKMKKCIAPVEDLIKPFLNK